MATSLTTNYGLTRTREMSPDAKDWAVTDGNFEIISRLLKALETHTHTGGSIPFHYPGYNSGDPTLPVYATLTEGTSGGILTPGTTVGVRLAYQDIIGLETDATPETSISLAIAVGRPDPPTQNSIQTAASALSGGTYVYVVTKKKGTGETLPSDILPVSINYDQTYSVTLGFDAINTYTDGTTALNIYRANGLNAAFQLVTTITSTSAVTYTDAGSISDPASQPPASSSFDASRKVTIDWSVLSHPGAAKKLRVYVTQQRGIWGNNCLLGEYDLPGAPTFVDYLGSESLASGSPSNASELITPSSKIDLSTQATGAPTLTANQNFAGFQAQNLRLHNNSGAPGSPTNGYIYYDTSTNNVRAYINGSWVTWGTTTATAYTHPAEEAGGHIAANIKFVASGVTVKSVLDRIADSAGAAKQVQTVAVITPTTNGPTTTQTTSSTSVFVPECSFTIPTRVFTGQQIEYRFSGTFAGPINQVINIALELNGTLITSTRRSATFVLNNQLLQLNFDYYDTATTGTAKVLWWTSGGTITAGGLQRSFSAKVVF